MTTQTNTRSKKVPIFRKILIPISALVVVEILLLIGVIFGGQITSFLEQNEKDILHERVINRKNYLENEMVGTWSNVSLTVQEINKKAIALAKDGIIDLDQLDDGSEACIPLILNISSDLISLMRNNRVNGAFVIFNNEDLSASMETQDYHNKPGIYMRDLDPSSNPSYRNMDLLLERAPAEVVRALNISTDSAWRPQFEFAKFGTSYYDFFYQPYQAALATREAGLTFEDCGYWSKPYILEEDYKEAISYSVPLMLNDGTVYGVLGIELTLDYLKKAMPYDELYEDKKGSYVLALNDTDTETFQNLIVNGPVYKQAIGDRTTTVLPNEQNSDHFIDTPEGEFYGSVEYLNLYNTNTPFSTERWALIGAVRVQDIFALTRQIRTILLTAILITLIAGVLGSLIASKIISRPIVSLAKSMDRMKDKRMVRLERSGIEEIDLLAASLERLSDELIGSAAKFTQIIEMASVKLAGFEYNSSDHSLFVTDGFFDLFHVDGIDTKTLAPNDFLNIMEDLRKYIVPDEAEAKDELIFKIPDKDSFLYVQLRYHIDNTRYIGLAEDITKARLEKEKIEHERDYDLLTGLINRRAFYRIMRSLFDRGEQALKVAALVMLDLDNLKFMNDTYGHDCGDKYIRSAAECFAEFTPPETIVSRISGDEFYLFFYGYENREQIRALIASLKRRINERTILLPNMQLSHIKVSGGIAWYPEDSTSMDELLRYSDYAMYKVKQSIKGELHDFDLGVYNREAYMMQNRAELAELLDKELVEYHFQPIVDAQTGVIFAYEALMRANMPTLRSPNDIITMAKTESKLNQIETLTWFHAIESFSDHVRAGAVEKTSKVFINTIANQCLSEESIKKFEAKFSSCLKNIVLEITEEEQIDEDSLLAKRELTTKWGAAIALDDYGSGYNSEKVLLQLSPEYIKVDISFIRGIDQDTDKQTIVSNIISYAHERRMCVVAEGVETLAEALTVMRMDVDYLQGYFLARPAVLPPPVSSEAMQAIRMVAQEKSQGPNSQ